MHIKKHTHVFNFIHVSLEALLIKVSTLFRFTWKTTPHDITIQLMNQIQQFIPDSKGGDIDEGKDT
ncbi:hypothetical protein ES703_29002 [subsurface metagenome]